VTEKNRFSKAVSKLLAVTVVGGATMLPTVAESVPAPRAVDGGTAVIERLVAVRAAAQLADPGAYVVAAGDDDDKFKDTFLDAWKDHFADSTTKG
jgi:hypothetical protein